MYYCVTTSYFSPQKDSIWGRRERERERGGGGGGGGAENFNTKGQKKVRKRQC